eukprot:scaffold224618_cov19-Tisochrysis_lutea.AAC.3
MQILHPAAAPTVAEQLGLMRQHRFYLKVGSWGVWQGQGWAWLCCGLQGQLLPTQRVLQGPDCVVTYILLALSRVGIIWVSAIANITPSYPSESNPANRHGK